MPSPFCLWLETERIVSARTQNEVEASHSLRVREAFLSINCHPPNRHEPLLLRKIVGFSLQWAE